MVKSMVNINLIINLEDMEISMGILISSNHYELIATPQQDRTVFPGWYR